MNQTASQEIPFQQTTESTRTQKTSSRLADIYAPIADPLAKVEQILRAELSSESPQVEQLLRGNWIGCGKRIRPVFLLLSAGACGGIEQAHLQLATAVEMIHCATLVHDDVLDNAKTRRHVPTVNLTWDNRASVLLGDFLFTHAFYVASQSGSAEALKVLARSANRVCEGEIRQNAWQGNFDLTEPEYLEMIADKTAELCSCSCRIGAMLSGADAETGQAFESYGRRLGIAFQIIDDILDLVGEPDQVGKTLGTDLINQKPTLPIIHSLKQSSPTQRQPLLELLGSQSAEAEQILALLDLTNSIEYARCKAREQANAALEFAQSLDASPYADSLTKLADFVCQRTY